LTNHALFLAVILKPLSFLCAVNFQFLAGWRAGGKEFIGKSGKETKVQSFLNSVAARGAGGNKTAPNGRGYSCESGCWVERAASAVAEGYGETQPRTLLLVRRRKKRAQRSRSTSTLGQRQGCRFHIKLPAA
jgi:hypothetical protein